MPSRIAQPPSPKERHPSQRDSSCSTKATPSSSLSSSSHSRASTCPRADPDRVVLLRGFYWRSSAADLRQVCEQDFGPVRVVLLYQGQSYPEAFVDFVHRRHAAKCVIHWARPTKIYRAKDRFKDGTSFINWVLGVTAHSYEPTRNAKDWARAWKERDRIERGELPKEVLAPRWKEVSVREEEERRMEKQHCQARYPSASRSKGRQKRIFGDSGSTGIQDRHSFPLIIDASVVGGTPMEIDTVLTGRTPVGSPSKDIMTAAHIDEYLEKIVEESDLATLSFAKAALDRAAQNFMEAVDEFDVLVYKYCTSSGAENLGVPCSGSFRAGKTSIEGAVGGQNAIGLVQSLFCVQRMIELGLRI